MKQYKIHLVVILLIAAIIVGAAVSNSGQPSQAAAIKSDWGMAAWQGDIFVLRGTALLKLNAELEVVKSVEIPWSGAPVPPEPPMPPEPPIPPQPGEPPAPSAPTCAQRPAAGSGHSALAADSYYIYALVGGNIFVFDHELNYVKSGTF